MHQFIHKQKNNKGEENEDEEEASTVIEGEWQSFNLVHFFVLGSNNFSLY